MINMEARNLVEVEGLEDVSTKLNIEDGPLTRSKRKKLDAFTQHLLMTKIVNSNEDFPTRLNVFQINVCFRE